MSRWVQVHSFQGWYKFILVIYPNTTNHLEIVLYLQVAIPELSSSSFWIALHHIVLMCLSRSHQSPIGLTPTLTLMQKDCFRDNPNLEIPEEINTCNTSANQISASASLDLDISAPQMCDPLPHPSTSHMHGLLPLPCLPPSSYSNKNLSTGSKIVMTRTVLDQRSWWQGLLFQQRPSASLNLIRLQASNGLLLRRPHAVGT